MNMFHSFLMMILVVFSGFWAMYAVFLPILKKYMQKFEIKFYMLPFLYILLLYSLAVSVIFFWIDRTDFIVSLSLWRAFLPLLLCTVIYAVSLLWGGIALKITVVAAISTMVLSYPVDAGFAYLPMNPMVTKVLLIAFFSVFCLGYPLMNSTVHTFTVPSVVTLFGVCLLNLFGGAPMYSALCAAFLAGLLLAYMAPNFYNEKLVFEDGACVGTAFLICSILLLQLGEFSFPSCVIFTSVFAAELLVALWNKFSVNHGGTLLENTFYYKAAQIRTAYVLSLDILKISAISLFFGCFQMSAVNTYSVFIISVLITMWLNSSIAKNRGKQSIREINRDFVDEVKQNISETKEALKKIQERHDNED